MTSAHTAHDMLRMLERHYLPENKPPAWAFLPEIQAPDSTRRADLICHGLAYATGKKLVGHEIKVTRADLLAELSDLTKADPWLKYCDEWWLVLADESLMDGLEIPEIWGIMTPPSGRRTRSMTVVRKAPRLGPKTQEAAYLTITAWLHWRLDQLRRHHEVLQKDYDRQTQEVHKLSNERVTPQRRTETQEWGLKIAALMERGRWAEKYQPGRRNLTAEEAVELLADVERTRGVIKNLEDSAVRAITYTETQAKGLFDAVQRARDLRKEYGRD